MRKFGFFCSVLLVVATLAAGGQQQQQGEKGKKVVLRFGHLATTSHPWHLAAIRFKEVVERNTNGGIEVQVYPNEQLGDQTVLLNVIRSGVVDIALTGEPMQNFGVPLAAMLAVPYLIEDSDHLQRVINGEPGRLIAKQISEKLDVYLLSYFARGPRDLTSNRPINSPADLKGMILRVPPVPLFINFWSAAGAKPTPMAISEVFTALQQGTVEGQENPLAYIYSANFYEVQKYVNVTEHVIGWMYIIMSNKKLHSLPEEWQKIVIDAGKEMQDYEHELFLKNEDKLKQLLIDKGMIFNPVDKEPFAKIARDVIYPAFTEEQQKVYRLIEQLK